LLTGATLMTPSAALPADKPGENSETNRKATGIAMAIRDGRCTLRSARLAVKRHRYPSSLEKDDPCTAVIATLR
jgi:hypothetical protein